MERDGRATPVGGRADLGQGRLWHPARKLHHIQLFVARDLDPQMIRQRVHNRRANTVQTTRRLIAVTGKFTARVQGAKDNLKRGF